MQLAWLIESKTLNGNAIWWSGDGWTSDSYDAIWFCRQKDAQKVADNKNFERWITITEHGFY